MTTPEPDLREMLRRAEDATDIAFGTLARAHDNYVRARREEQQLRGALRRRAEEDDR